MSIQMALLAGQGRSTITAQLSVIEEIKVGSGFVAIGFLNNGNQVEIVNGSTSAIGQWVVPASSAAEWEIRASLDSGDTPSGTLGTWLDFSVNRQWELSLSSAGIASCTLTFEFRRVGDTVAEFTSTNNSLTIEVVSPF